MSEIKIKHKLPSFILQAAETLRSRGYEAYLVGGSVRDILLGKEPKDYDIATNAYPEQIAEIFEKTIPTGAKFGTMLVLLADENGEDQEIEITTYRSEADYFGGRWPAKVEFTKTIQEDLARRDFTINAIALRLDDADLETEDIVDPFNGKADLQNRTIRAVGDAMERFTEDGLRSLRACRLAANLNFDIESKTFDAIKKTLHVTKHVSMERVRDEIMKMLLKSAKPSVGIELMRQSGLLGLFIPELLECIEVNQPQFHSDDVYVHTLKAVDAAEDSVKLAALFHDIGKPRTKSEDESGIHFYGHDQVGADMAREIMKRLKFSNAEIDRTANLVRWHMFYYPNADWRKSQAIKLQENNPETIATIYVLRHGETNDNNNKIVSGQLDVELNENGIKQAENIAQELALFGISKIISSPLKRTIKTAEIIAGKLNLPVQTDARFIERNFGELQGLNWQQFAEKFPDLANRPDNNEQRQEYLPAGETIDRVESRVRIALYNVVKSNFGKSVLIVTHQGVIRVIKRILNNVSIEESVKTDLNSCEYIKFSIDLADLDPAFLSDDELEIVRQEQLENQTVNAGGWGDGAVRRFIKNVGGEEVIEDLMKLRIADALANPKTVFNPMELKVLGERIAKVRSEDMALKLSDLDVSGHDLMEMGLKGQMVGQTLNYLLEKVIDDPKLNEKNKLLQLAQEHVKLTNTNPLA